jgi:PAS domain S-box-containing protein
MSERESYPGDAAELRRRAEKLARGKTAQALDNLEALSPEEIRRTVHELKVHQIELEMQNEELRRAQAELDAARARYFDLYDLAPVGYCTVNEQGLILEANLVAAGLLGVPRTALVKQRFTRFILPGDEDIYYLYRKHLFEAGQPQACELRMLELDGTVFWARLEASAAENADGAPVNRIVISDITERKRAEEALRESEKHKLLFESAGDAIFIFDAQAHMLAVNQTACEALGYTHAELMSMTVGQVDSPEEARHAPDRIARIMEHGHLTFETVHRRKDGSPVPVEVSARRIAWGGQPAVLSICRDITERKRAEEALRVSERRYRSLFKHMLDGFAYCQMLYDDRDRPVDFVYLEVNAAFERLTGLRDVVGKRVSEVIPGIREQSPELLEMYGRVASTGKPESCEICVKPLSRWRNISVYSPGKGYIVAVFDDISDRKRNEADRETMLALLRLANASNNTQELIHAVAAELQRWSGCEAVGVRLRDGDEFPYFETRGFPAEFVEAENHLCARDASGELLRDSQGDPVLECMCGNILCGRFDPRLPFFTPGGSFWTNSTTKLLESTTEADRQSPTRNRCNAAGFESVALIPLPSSGRTLGLLQFNDPRPDRFTPDRIALMERAAASLAIALEQRITQAALRESEERYRLISENTADVIWLLDVATGRFTYASPSVQRVFGYSPAEVLTKGLRDMLTPKSYQHASSRLAGALAAFDSGDESVRARASQVDQLHKNGSIVRTEVVTTLVRNRQGRAGEILGVTRDITERVQAEARLTQAQKMESIGRLAGGVAHDFNNLLTVINGYSQLLLRKLRADDPLRADLEQIQKAGERAAGLTRQLLAFSRKQVLELRVLDLNRVVEEMGPMLERLMGEDVEVRVVLNAERGTVRADPHQLEQVLVNLAVNARDAMPGGGKLLIETALVERDGSYAQSHPDVCVGCHVMLAVSDNGVGMEEETRRRIFEPFFTTKGVGQGTGLGLSMVQGIVAQSGGHIEVYSEPDQGTTFKIYLPALAEAAADAGKPAVVPALEGQETVLVVEDQAEVRDYAVAALKTYGYRVIPAENAGEALLVCERERGRIHLVLTDVVMPNVSGRELANRLSERWPGIKVLFMSGYTDNVVMQHGVLEEGAEFIQKPFSPEELARKVRAVLGPPAPVTRILVADDEAGVRAFLRDVLEQGGHEVTEAADGKQALQQARANPVDLVITDLVMPKQEGIETIRALRKEMPGIGIIAITGKFEGPYLKMVQMLGADAVLTKPVSPEVLLAKVAEVLKLIFNTMI